MFRYQGGKRTSVHSSLVIGYTCEREISRHEVQKGKLSALNVLPTIYYQDGRLTLEHKRKVGVHGFGGMCEFFGNVPYDVAQLVPEVPKQPTEDFVKKELGKFLSYARHFSAWCNCTAGWEPGYVLVEVWKTGSGSNVSRAGHRSRNWFYWAGTDPVMQEFLHELPEILHPGSGNRSAPSKSAGSAQRAVSPSRPGPSGQRAFSPARATGSGSRPTKTGS
jgi:hypothetical protein